MHFQLNKVADLAGVVLESAKSGEVVNFAPGALVTSDEPIFYRCMEGLVNTFLNHFLLEERLPIEVVQRLLIVLHADSTADVYLNDFDIESLILPKGPITKGQAILLKDIANLEKVSFPNITIVPTDKVIFCFRMGWRFGLYFDLMQRVQPKGATKPVPVEPLDIEKMQIRIGDLYRYLMFYHVYKALEVQQPFENMVKDGWFPFIEIAAGEFKDLTEAYDPKADTDSLVRGVVDRFGVDRLGAITAKWWSKPAFQDKKPIIEAAVNAYLQNSPDGFINCIKNLATEVEGVLRKIYLVDTGKGHVTSTQLIKHIVGKGKAKSQSRFSLLLPEPFLEYLEKIVFAGFNVDTGDVMLSRHSSSHGVADPELYKKERALQLILILDQMYYYL